MLDILICGGTIVDGTGEAGSRGDLGIRDGRIVAVGEVDEPAREVIDAAGKVVSPGFVDIHTHYDAQAFWDPLFSPSCFHGVTSVFGGFCGFSIAPLTPDAGAYLLPMLARVEGMPEQTLRAGVPWDWSSFGDFLGRLEGKVGLNCGFFVGHSAVRRVVMGERAVGSLASEDEIAAMRDLVDRSLSEGAMGFSSTVSTSHNDADGNPVPSRHASREELLTLAAVVRDHPGTTLELLPNLDFGDETINLLVDFSIAGQRAVNWNILVLRGGGPDEVARMERMLSASDRARAKGGEVVALTLACSSSLRINWLSGFILDALPDWDWLFRLGPAERMEQMRDPAVWARLKAGAARQQGQFATFADFANYYLLETPTAVHKSYEGRLMADIAAERGQDVLDAMIDIVLIDELRTSFQPRVKGEDEATYALRRQLLQDNRILVGGSDAGAHMDMIDSFAFSTKLLQRSRDKGLMSVEEAVRLMTQVPAEYFGLKDRGVLKVGNHADVVVFDPAKVGCGPLHTRYDLPGTSENGRLYAEADGIDKVIVNGVVLIDGNVAREVRPGTVLRSGRDSVTVPIPRYPVAA